MKNTLITLFFILINSFFVQAQSISDGARISLLTGSPGTELYNTFGHSAIRIKDSRQGLDEVYNYGTFDFRTSNFYVKFARGKLDYMLSKETYKQFEAGFRYENRSVVEQVLNLTFDQKEKLYKLILENYKPENRFYRYDFFFDNCATRIRDLMTTAFGAEFTYNYPKEWETSNLTFRNLIDLYLTNHHWSDFGIDLALGLPTDAVASPSDYMFLPDYLAKGFETASIKRDGEIIPFAKKGVLIIPRKDIEPSVFMITPLKLMWTLFMIGAFLSYLSFKNALRIHWFDVLYFNVIGLVGWVVFLLWFFTDHIATKDNLNLLWAVPVYLPLFFFWNKLSFTFRKWLTLVLGGINVIILLFWMVFPQHYHIAFIPLILIIIIRFFFLYKELKTNQTM